jgi:hypothetical protein
LESAFVKFSFQQFMRALLVVLFSFTVEFQNGCSPVSCDPIRQLWIAMRALAKVWNRWRHAYDLAQHLPSKGATCRQSLARQWASQALGAGLFAREKERPISKRRPVGKVEIAQADVFPNEFIVGRIWRPMRDHLAGFLDFAHAKVLLHSSVVSQAAGDLRDLAR